MIKNIKLKVSADPRGKIKSGMKNAKGLPQSLDYFNVGKFPELQQAYGLKPAVLILFFPTNNIRDFFDCNYVLYGKETKIRSCDGERCIHRIDEEIGNVKYKAGEESECTCLKHKIPDKDKKRCHYNAFFKAYIAMPQSGKVDSPMCYLFETGSHNSGENILSELEKIRVLNNGVLIGVPFALSIKMVSGKEDAKLKFPIWSLTPIGLLSAIKSRTNAFSLDTSDEILQLAAHQDDIQPASDTPEHKLLSVIPAVFQNPKEDRLQKLLSEVKSAKTRSEVKTIFDKAQKMKLSDDEQDALRDVCNAMWAKVK